VRVGEVSLLRERPCGVGTHLSAHKFRGRGGDITKHRDDAGERPGQERGWGRDDEGNVDEFEDNLMVKNRPTG
jgi:hypothetical protein